ncbi:hypothetical protein ACP70R_031337 [Stipagrostis hirtigluma subsp. patula]
MDWYTRNLKRQERIDTIYTASGECLCTNTTRRRILSRTTQQHNTCSDMAKKLVLLLAVCAVLLEASTPAAAVQWTPAFATFYGGGDASGTMGGACGYGNLYDAGYGTRSTALSSVLFNDGAMCGACFAIACDARRSRWCKPGAPPVTVTATNLCPPNWALPSDNGGWCNPPRRHFDMSQPAWETIAVYRAGIVPVNYRRVPCRRSGGVRFAINGHSYFELVTITNVGGSGVVAQAWIKGSGTEWMAMSRNWGANWQSNAYLNGQSLSFRLRSDDGRVVTANNVAPAAWWFGATYTSRAQFY